MSCTLFNITDGGITYAGYNFDWFSGGGKVRFLPPAKNRYGYFITTRFGRNFPYEGMNEHGLYACQTAVPVVKSTLSLRKKWVFSTGIIVRMMERCATLGEAVSLFNGHFIIFGTALGFAMAHFMIADRSGESAVIEVFPDGNRVRYKEGRYQLITNHYLSEPEIQWPNPVPGCGGYERFKIAEERLKGADDITPEYLFDTLKAASMNDWRYDDRTWNTVFSNVHDLVGKETRIVYGKNYPSVFHFQLDDELKRGTRVYDLEKP